MIGSVQVVIINWKRPRNVERIIAAFKSGSYPVKILLADCHPERPFRLKSSYLRIVDDVIRLKQNLGPPSRFIPAFAHLTDTQYTYFHDDDGLPSPQLVESFVKQAQVTPNFSVLGYEGRNFRLRRKCASYIRRPLRRSSIIYPVDSTIRFHFVKNEYLYALLKFTSDWKSLIPDQDQLLLEDDLLLNIAIQSQLMHPSLVLPITDLEDRITNLPAPHSHSSRSQHYPNRNLFVKLCYSVLGWRRPMNSLSF